MSVQALLQSDILLVLKAECACWDGQPAGDATTGCCARKSIPQQHVPIDPRRSMELYGISVEHMVGQHSFLLQRVRFTTEAPPRRSRTNQSSLRLKCRGIKWDRRRALPAITATVVQAAGILGFVHVKTLVGLLECGYESSVRKRSDVKCADVLHTLSAASVPVFEHAAAMTCLL